jgi:hypothetical protein
VANETDSFAERIRRIDGMRQVPLQNRDIPEDNRDG